LRLRVSSKKQAVVRTGKVGPMSSWFLKVKKNQMDNLQCLLFWGKVLQGQPEILAPISGQKKMKGGLALGQEF